MYGWGVLLILRLEGCPQGTLQATTFESFLKVSPNQPHFHLIIWSFKSICQFVQFWPIYWRYRWFRQRIFRKQRLTKPSELQKQAMSQIHNTTLLAYPIEFNPPIPLLPQPSRFYINILEVPQTSNSSLFRSSSLNILHTWNTMKISVIFQNMLFWNIRKHVWNVKLIKSKVLLNPRCY